MTNCEDNESQTIISEERCNETISEYYYWPIIQWPIIDNDMKTKTINNGCERSQWYYYYCNRKTEDY